MIKRSSSKFKKKFFLMMKNTIKRMRRHATAWEKILQITYLTKAIYSEYIFKTVKTDQERNNPFEK